MSSPSDVDRWAGNETFVGQYKLGRTLGQGIFAKVRLGEDDLGRKFAVKVFDKKAHRTDAQLKQVEREINALRLLDHPHIAQFFEVLESQSKVFLVMEFVTGGELYEYIHKTGKLPERDAARLFYQICSAVEHCHSKNIVHRDLKPENILLTEPPPGTIPVVDPPDGLGGRRAKIVDFGLTNFTGRDKYGEVPSEELKDVLLKTQCGSPHYAAPEVLQGKEYKGRAVDVWSLGIILYAMMCARLPFHAGTVPQLMKKIVDGYYQLPEHLSASAKDLIQRMLKIKPEQRLTIQEVMAHPWMKTHGPHIIAPSRAQAEIDASLPSMTPLEGTDLTGDLEDGFEEGDDSKLGEGEEEAMPVGSAIPPTRIVREKNKGRKNGVKRKTAKEAQRCKRCGKLLTMRRNEKGYVFLQMAVTSPTDSSTDSSSATSTSSSSSSSSSSSASSSSASSSSTSTSTATTSSSSSTSSSTPTSALTLSLAAKGTSSADTSSTPSSAVSMEDLCQCPEEDLEDAKKREKKPDKPESENTAEAMQEELFRAAESGNIHRILGILSMNAAKPGSIDLDAKTVKMWTALHYAAYMGHVGVVEALVTSMQKLNVDSLTENLWTPLMMAADRGHIEIVRVLIECGASIHAQNSKGKTAIYIAREKDHSKIAELLTEVSSEKRKKQDALDAEVSFRTQLFRAAEDGDVSKLKVLLAQHFPLNTPKEEGSPGVASPAPASSISGGPSTIPASPTDGKGRISLGTTGIDNWTALHYAARKGHANVVHVLLTYVQDAHKMLYIDARTRNGWTPLMLAADKGHLKVVQVLLKHRANPLMQNSDDKTALDLSRENGHEAVTSLLEKSKLILLD